MPRKRWKQWLAWAYIGHFVVFLLTAPLWFFVSLAGKDFGSPFPDAATGHVFPLEAQLHGPSVVYYVSHRYRLIATILEDLATSWVIVAIPSTVVLVVYGWWIKSHKTA